MGSMCLLRAAAWLEQRRLRDEKPNDSEDVARLGYKHRQLLLCLYTPLAF